jgi:hypothetical protein
MRRGSCYIELPALSSIPLRPGHDHIDFAAAASRTGEPLAPIEDGRFGAVPSGHVGWVGLDLMPTIAAPNDYSRLGRRSPAERRGRAAIGFT